MHSRLDARFDRWIASPALEAPSSSRYPSSPRFREFWRNQPRASSPDRPRTESKKASGSRSMAFYRSCLSTSIRTRAWASVSVARVAFKYFSLNTRGRRSSPATLQTSTRSAQRPRTRMSLDVRCGDDIDELSFTDWLQGTTSRPIGLTGGARGGWKASSRVDVKPKEQKVAKAPSTRASGGGSRRRRHLSDALSFTGRGLESARAVSASTSESARSAEPRKRERRERRAKTNAPKFAWVRRWFSCVHASSIADEVWIAPLELESREIDDGAPNAKLRVKSEDRLQARSRAARSRARRSSVCLQSVSEMSEASLDEAIEAFARARGRLTPEFESTASVDERSIDASGAIELTDPFNEVDDRAWGRFVIDGDLHDEPDVSSASTPENLGQLFDEAAQPRSEAASVPITLIAPHTPSLDGRPSSA